MRIIIIYIIGLLSLSSCSKKYVQVATVKSDILQNDTLLRYENDTFEIVYNLFSENGLLAFTIYNKSNVPLYIDWKRSAYIKGSEKFAYWEDKSNIYSVTEGSSVRWLRDYSTTRNYSTSVITKPEQITFIPPKTAVSMARYNLSSSVWGSGLSEDTIASTLKRGITKIWKKSFDASTSPFAFRNFLTLSQKHDFSTEFYIDHSFWVSDIMKIQEKEFGGSLIITNTNEYGRDLYNYSFPYRKPNSFYTDIYNN